MQTISSGLPACLNLAPTLSRPSLRAGCCWTWPAFLGHDIVPAGTAYGRREIEGAAERQGVRIEKGDVVLLHGAWMKNYDKGAEAWLWPGWPGLNAEGAEYLAGLGVVAVGADNAGLEAWDGKGGAPGSEVHQILLAKNGVYIIEGVWTLALAADKVSEFMFVLGQPRFVGAAQMVVNPIAHLLKNVIMVSPGYTPSLFQSG